MSIIQVLPIRFGFSNPTTVSQAMTKYYDRLSSVAFHDLDAPHTLICQLTIPVALERSMSWESVSELICDGFTSEDPQAIILDLGGIEERDVARPNNLMGALTAIDRLKANKPYLKVLLHLPQKIAAGDLLEPTVRRVVEDSNVRLLTSTGDSLGEFFRVRPPNGGQVKAWAIEARQDPIEGLQQKLIRRVGQYKLPQADDIVRHLYDGTKSFDEIYDIALRHLAEELHDDDRILIAYDVRHSPWFTGPVEAALRKTNLLDRTVRIDENWTPQLIADVTHFMLPIVRTGMATRCLFEQFSNLDGPPPTVWSLLSTDGDREINGERRVTISSAPANVRHADVRVRYSLRVPSDEEASDLEFWRSSRIPSIDPDDEVWSSDLSSDAMWSMIFEAGLVDENPVPIHRSTIGLIPNFGRLAEKNGAFLAFKLEAMLKARFESTLSHSLGFLCPNEPHAEALSTALRDLAGHDTILVDRKVIELFRRNAPIIDSAVRYELGDLAVRLDGWKSLSSKVALGERPQIVLLDEFNASGSTFTGLYNLAWAFELPIFCAVSLAEFSDPTVRLSVPTVSMYQLGMVA